jgi:hypothetical protein
MGVAAGCASIDDGTGGTGGEAPGPTVACTNSETTVTSLLDWQLTVSPSPDPIESGEPFTATLDGIALFDEGFLDAAQELPGGVQEVDLVDLSATVHVRLGATGDDVILTPDPIQYPYVCFRSRNACNPANDVLDDPPDPPGLRGNTDCEPIGAANPCGRFIILPTSSDGGVCANLEKTEQHDDNGFCITGDGSIELQEATGHYTAAAEGLVLFGWDDQSTGATIQEGGPNDGTWILPEADYYADTGPNALRVTVRGIPVALECTMGVNCMDPDSGIDCAAALPSPTPSSALISFPIQTEAP